MPVAALPAELWLNILAYEDNDKCHLWFAVRRVSRDFQYYAEKILAVPTIAQASITIHVSQTQIRRHAPEIFEFGDPQRFFLFKFTRFSPNSQLAVFVPKSANPPLQHRNQFYEPAYSSPPKPDIFCTQWAQAREVLPRNVHFVRLQNTLKSLRLPDLAFDTDAKEISFDWRKLCQLFYWEVLTTRRVAKPWLQNSAFSMHPDDAADRWIFSN